MALNAMTDAFRRFYKEGGFSVASAVSFSFILSLFPFFVFSASVAEALGAAHHFRGIVELFFALFPDEVSRPLIPEIWKAINNNDVGVLTLGGISMVFFASNGIESLRMAFNTAYRDEENRSYIWQRIQGLFFVVESAFAIVIIGCFLIWAPELAQMLVPYMPETVDVIFTERAAYAVMLTMMLFQFYLYHRYLPAAQHSFSELWPGIFLSLVLWLVLAALFSLYLRFANYDALYAGVSHLVIALIFFQITAAILILGANFNRALRRKREESA